MLEAFLSNGKLYFTPTSIFLIKLSPISYRKGEWKLSFVDHEDQEHIILEGTLGKCCSMIEGLKVKNEKI